MLFSLLQVFFIPLSLSLAFCVLATFFRIEVSLSVKFSTESRFNSVVYSFSWMLFFIQIVPNAGETTVVFGLQFHHKIGQLFGFCCSCIDCWWEKSQIEFGHFAIISLLTSNFRNAHLYERSNGRFEMYAFWFIHEVSFITIINHLLILFAERL